MPHITFHGLRHTHATLLISQGLDVRTVSNRLGHAQTSTTLNIYAHAFAKMDREASDKLDNLLYYQIYYKYRKFKVYQKPFYIDLCPNGAQFILCNLK